MSAPYLSSPDQPSSVFPDRLIRPLPKRTIRSRLSQETAESIAFPPNPPSASLPTYTHYADNGDIFGYGKHMTPNGTSFDLDHDHDHGHDHEDNEDGCLHHHCNHDHDEEDFDSADDSSPVALRHSSSYRSSPRSPRSRHQRFNSYSTKESGVADGYEAFENTNNKKKRKIPTSGNLGLHHTSITSELASMGLNSPRDMEDGQYYNSSSGPTGLGMQGAGRGRHPRKHNLRNPLGVSVNGSNARNGPNKYKQNAMVNSKGEETKSDQGIISTAIANATALLRKPSGKSQENEGVLDQQARTGRTNSQFTFTCEADAKGVKFPEQSLYSMDYSQRVNSTMPGSAGGSHQKFATHGTQTSPGMPSRDHQQMPAHSNMAESSLQGKKPRRRRGDAYALAARQRKLQQEYINLQHPQSLEDIWICEFCEYESIFGEPPRALIRQYEIKDRRERKRLAEKQRLLEKAKLKGRKGKKQTKNAAKAANQAAHQSVNQQTFDDASMEALADDYLDDDFDEEDDVSGPMPLPPTSEIQSGSGSHNYHHHYHPSGKSGGGGTGSGIK